MEIRAFATLVIALLAVGCLSADTTPPGDPLRLTCRWQHVERAFDGGAVFSVTFVNSGPPLKARFGVGLIGATLVSPMNASDDRWLDRGGKVDVTYVVRALAGERTQVRGFIEGVYRTDAERMATACTYKVVESGGRPSVHDGDPIAPLLVALSANESDPYVVSIKMTSPRDTQVRVLMTSPGEAREQRQVFLEPLSAAVERTLEVRVGPYARNGVYDISVRVEPDAAVDDSTYWRSLHLRVEDGRVSEVP